MDATILETPPTPAAEAAGTGGGQTKAPVRHPGVFARSLARWKENPWAPVVTRTLAISAGMLALAGIGAASIASGRGMPVAAAAAAGAASTEPAAVWTPPERGPAAHESPHPAASPPAGAASPASATPPASGAPAASPPPPGDGAGLTADGRVVLNRAGVEDLVRLPKVGPKRAQAIVDLRTRLGRFRQPTDLLRVRGIGRTTLKQMLPHLVVDPPPPPKEEPGKEGAPPAGG